MVLEIMFDEGKGEWFAVRDVEKAFAIPSSSTLSDLVVMLATDYVQNENCSLFSDHQIPGYHFFLTEGKSLFTFIFELDIGCKRCIDIRDNVQWRCWGHGIVEHELHRRCEWQEFCELELYIRSMVELVEQEALLRILSRTGKENYNT